MLLHSRPQSQLGKNTASTTPRLIASAGSGQLISEFTPDIIVAKDGKIERSEAYTAQSPVGGKFHLYTVIYKTQVTTPDLVAAYKKYAMEHGYAVWRLENMGTNATIFLRPIAAEISTLAIAIKDTISEREVSIVLNKE